MEMDIGEIVAGVIGAGMSLLLWLLNMVAQKRKNSSEIDRNEATTDNLESTTIQNLVKAVAEIQELYQELIENHGLAVRENLALVEELSGLSRELINIKTEYEKILAQNEIMLKQSKVMKITIDELEQVVIEEQMNKQRLRTGTRKLILQLEDAGLEPIFAIEDKENE